jgi:Outer membrane protein beta-barrel domain
MKGERVFVKSGKSRVLLILGLAGCVLSTTAADAAAQQPPPIGRFVIDARGSLARFKADGAIATGLNVTTDNLPTRGLGIDAGVHWYPLRKGKVTFGLGGELLFARDSRMADPTDTTDTTVVSPRVTTRFASVSPQVSLNFGTGEGWSYVSGGIGLASLTSERNDLPFTDDASRVRTTNYGGGARWFTGPHLAFTFDVRFYAVSAQAATTVRPAYPKTTFMVISAGVSLR